MGQWRVGDAGKTVFGPAIEGKMPKIIVTNLHGAQARRIVDAHNAEIAELDVWASCRTDVPGLSVKDIREFREYLKACTDAQVQGVYDKEKSAGRDDYADLAVAEAERRGITLETK